uniref:Uncharacterized protein n=1 Tax=Cacopsylla melanoneura TaxID=428564 RepID=A0A8D8PZC7_9HEMI
MKIVPSQYKVHAFGGYPLEIIGNVTLKLKNKDRCLNTIFAVMQDRKGIRPILGRQASEDLGLIKRLDTVNKSSDEFNEEIFLEENKEVFEGLGKFPQSYKIQLEKNEIPTVKPPRRVAFITSTGRKTR